MVTHDESMAERVTRKVVIVDGEIRMGKSQRRLELSLMPLEDYAQATQVRACAPDRHDQAALIEMVDICKVFKSPAGEFTVLKDISACFYEGEFVSVVGRSGSGKSTLVNMLTGIDHPSCGSVRILDAYPHR
jgi:ABC-type lipoprotein export system ATPase subunit